MENNNKGNVVKMIKDVMVVLLIFSAVGLSNARSTRSIQDCRESEYFDNEQGMCEACKTCPKGEEPDPDDPREEMNQNYCANKDVKCKRCKENYYSVTEGQDMCKPCTASCSRLNKVTLADCTPISNRRCGGCIKGYYYHEGSGLCETCEYLTIEKKIENGCPLPTTRSPTTTTPTRTPSPSVKVITTQRTQITSLHLEQTTPSTLKQTLKSLAPDVGQGKQVNQFADPGIILLGALLVLGILCLFVFRTVKICINRRSNSDSEAKQGDIFNSLSSTRTTSAETSGGSKHNESDNEHNNLDLVQKKCEGKGELNIEMEETQMGADGGKPDGEKQKHQQQSSPSTPPVNSPDATSPLSNPNQNLNDLGCDKPVAKQKQGKHKSFISTNKTCSLAQNTSNENCQQKMDDKRRGEESIQGGEKESLLTPQSNRRISADRGILPLSRHGGKMSSGSSYAPDSVVTTSTSRNNTSTTSDIGSLSSNPDKQNRKANKLKTQLSTSSYDNGMMETPDPDDPATPFLINNGQVMQESGADNGLPAYLTYQHLDHLPESPGSRDQVRKDHNSTAKCLYRTNNSTSAPSPTQSPSRDSSKLPQLNQQGKSNLGHGCDTSRTASQRPSNPGRSDSPSHSSNPGSLPTHVPGGSGLDQSTRGPPSSSTNIVYNGTVITIQGGQVLIGDKSTQFNQHGASGGNSTTEPPTTPKTMQPCTEA